MAEAQSMSGFGDALGFIVLEGLGHPSRYSAETAGPRADVAQDHKSGGAPRVAFRPVGTPGILTDGLQPQFSQQIARKEIPVAAWRLSLQPCRQSLP